MSRAFLSKKITRLISFAAVALSSGLVYAQTMQSCSFETGCNELKEDTKSQDVPHQAHPGNLFLLECDLKDHNGKVVEKMLNSLKANGTKKSELDLAVEIYYDALGNDYQILISPIGSDKGVAHFAINAERLTMDYIGGALVFNIDSSIGRLENNPILSGRRMHDSTTWFKLNRISGELEIGRAIPKKALAFAKAKYKVDLPTVAISSYKCKKIENGIF